MASGRAGAAAFSGRGGRGVAVRMLASAGHQRAHSISSSRTTAKASPRQHVVVLDFDGVVVDSESEVSTSARRAALHRWPDVLLDAARLQRAMARMRDVRPVLVRGYESMMMLRLLYEDPSEYMVSSILACWGSELGQALSRWSEDPEALAAVFEQLRNAWMASEPDEWMAQQQPYAGVPEALAHSPHHIYLATSKAAHRVSALMERRLHYRLPPNDPRLYASLLPPEEAKARALADIASKHLTSHLARQCTSASGPSASHQASHEAWAGAAEVRAGPGLAATTAVLVPPNGPDKEGLGPQSLLGGEAAEVVVGEAEVGQPVFHFVEDRLETLLAMQHSPEPHLALYRLYLADWGYCTCREREQARRTPGITVIQLPQFISLLRQGRMQ